MSERLVVDDVGQLVVATRANVHRSGLQHYCVHLLCYSGADVFLQRRAASRTRNAGRWTSTVSGHITEQDARRGAGLVIDVDAALTALRHEVPEEIGIDLSVLGTPRYVDQVPTMSHGGGERCACRAFVFALSVQNLPPVSTHEVVEVRRFSLSNVFSALKSCAGLIGADFQQHRFADNFAPVFNCFAAAGLSTEAGD